MLRSVRIRVSSLLGQWNPLQCTAEFNKTIQCINSLSFTTVNAFFPIVYNLKPTVLPCSNHPPVSLWWLHTENTTKATHGLSLLISTAAIQMLIAQDIWWFSNLCSCHQEMGRADPCHPYSASQTAQHLHLNLSLRSLSPTATVSSTCSPNVRTDARWQPPQHVPGVAMTCSAAVWYNVTLSLDNSSTVTCGVSDLMCMLSHNNTDPHAVHRLYCEAPNRPADWRNALQLLIKKKKIKLMRCELHTDTCWCGTKLPSLFLYFSSELLFQVLTDLWNWTSKTKGLFCGQFRIYTTAFIISLFPGTILFMTAKKIYTYFVFLHM